MSTNPQPEALRLADELEFFWGPYSGPEEPHELNAAAELRRLHALTEPEQEPVAWMSQGGDVSRSKKHFDEMGFVDSIPLYTSPPARKPLTDNTLWEMWVESPSDVMRFARAIERAHGIGD